MFITGLVLGLYVGAAIGILVMCALTVSGRADSHNSQEGN